MTTVTRTSQLTGATHTRDIPVDRERLSTWTGADPRRRPHVQDAFPDLSDDDREYLLTGITPEEWAATFGDEE